MLNFVQIDQMVETWNKGVHKQNDGRKITRFLFGMGDKVEHKVTGHSYQDSDQTKSTKDVRE